jgi:hypothetical protein
MSATSAVAKQLYQDAYTTITVNEPGWASLYHIYQTMYRVFVTQIVTRLLSPDGSVEVSRIATPTSYLYTQYEIGRATQFMGITRIGSVLSPSLVLSQPVPAAPLASATPAAATPKTVSLVVPGVPMPAAV